jgi:diguanylate cyclase (GGDEF)-like protein/PAS domain S-box-containing protein
LSDRAGEAVGGRFALVHLLKRGNGVTTHQAVDLATGAPVVVKMLTTAGVSTAVRLRLEHEAAVLEHLDIGSGAPLVASGHDGDRFYLVQPLFDGITLRSRLDEGRLSVRSALTVAIDVLRVLELAHDRGVLHRDVKPSNIIVRGGDPIVGADLIDFGLALSGELDVSLRDEPVGTARYVAPEAAGLINAVVDHRADLYSLGIVLFEALAGEPPFSAATVGEVLRHHLNTPAPHLRALGIAVPRALDGVIHRLLGKDPDARYQSAAAALVDLSDIREALWSGISEPAVTPGRRDRRRALTEPAFVGRQAELATLMRHVHDMGHGGGGVVLVEAESGGGKTRLLDEVALQAGKESVWVLRGQGVDNAAQRPYQVLDGILDGLRAVAADRTVVGGLRRLLGDRADAAVAALPGLGPIIGVDSHEAVGPEAYGETRSIDALTSLLDGLGAGGRPALVILDDCQWADGLTLSLLERWQARRATSPQGPLVVAAFRSEEVPTGHALRELRPLASVALAPFGDDDVEALCTSMAGPLPIDALATVVRLAEGSPFMASAVLRGMVESGALRDTADGWDVDPGPMRDAQTSRRAALFLTRRFELLGPAALTLLTVGAVLGKEFSLDLAVSLTGQDASDVTPALDQARRRRMLWVDEADGRCTFTHDKLRETLLARIDHEERRALHHRAAERIEEIGSERVFELAYHFDAAGLPARALPYALAAAEGARARHSLDVAITHYLIAARATEGGGDDSLRMRIAMGLGECFTLQGDYVEGSRQLQAAVSLASDPVDRAVLEGKLGDVAFKRGDQDEAAHHLEGALRDLGCRVPRGKAGYVVALVREALVQVLHTALPRLFVGRRRLEGSEREFLAIRMYSRLAYVYWFSAGKIPCGWSHLREMNLAERYPPTPERAQAYSEHAPVMTMVPWYSRGTEYARRSLAIRRDLGDVWGQGQSLNFSGVVAYAASRYAECIEHCREAVRLLERTGDRWEQNTAIWHLVFSHHRLGELDTAVRLARELYADATAIGDQTAAGVVLGGWARAASGRVPAEYIRAELARDTGDAQTAAEVHLADGIRLLFGGDVDGGVARLREAAAIVADAGLRQEYVAPVKPWLTTALRMQVEQLDPLAVAPRRQALRHAGRAARQADRLARSYRNNRPHTLRERGLIAALEGRTRRARRLLGQSVAVAEAQDAAYEAALSREALARCAVIDGVDGAVEQLAEATSVRLGLEPVAAAASEARVEEPATLSLADRFELLLVTGRRIGAAGSPEAVYEAVREAARLLLRGERCHVIELVDGEPESMTTASGERLVAVSRSLISKAVAGRTPVVSRRGIDADPSESLVLSDIRSVLCAPIVCDDEVVACFYVTHAQVHDLFGDTETQLAAFIATLAGAALEHVAGSEARFRSLAQNSSDVVTIVSPEGTITYQSASVRSVFGYGPGDLGGSDLRAWVHPDDAPRLLAALDRAPGSPPPAGLVEARLLHRDGTWRTVETAVTPMFDVPGVSGLVLNSRDISVRIALESELRLRAWHDPLTGLANRTLFVERVGAALARDAADPSFAVVFLDLDDFKSVNDTLGHAAGDLLLRGIGERLLTCVRPGDTVARFGGDEFALLLEDASPVVAESVAQRIIDELVEPFRILEQEIHARASVGVALAGGMESAEDLLSGADAAMYVAKARGKSRYEVFESQMRAATLARAELRTDLEWALARGELVVHYQPIFDLVAGGIAGFEALVRWEHPRRGLLGPADFIDLAEESGLVLPIGDWILRQACAQVRQWGIEHDTPFTVAVNLAARQLLDADFAASVAAALEATGLAPGRLVLEITESATVEDTEAVLARLVDTRALGVGMAIDDFGTGYSSLSYLRRFPVDQLKLDRTFVAGVTTTAEDVTIVLSVISLGHALGLRVVAEGVETIEQLDRLCEMGCDMAQGFNWLHPADAAEVGEWLRRQQSVRGVLPTPHGVRVLVADDRDGVRATIRQAFEVEQGFDVVGEASDAQTTIQLAGVSHPDLILLDVAMPMMSGIEAIPDLRRAAPEAKIILLSALEREVVLAGGGDTADGVFDKTRDLTELLDQMAAIFSP